MARKALRVLLPASVAVLVASQWREIARFLKISQMSRGDGHPHAVPAGGKHAYTRRSGAADGTGDFDFGKPRRRPLLRLTRAPVSPNPRPGWSRVPRTACCRRCRRDGSYHRASRGRHLRTARGCRCD